MSSIMILFSIMGIVFSLCIHKNVEKKILLIFNIYWIFLIIASIKMPYGDHYIGVNSYSIFCVFMGMINFGYLLGVLSKSFLPIEKNNVKTMFDFELLLKSKMFQYFLILAVCIYVYYALKYYKAVQIVGGVEARNLRFYVGPLFANTLELLCFNYFISPIKYLASFIIAMEFYIEKIDIGVTLKALFIVILSSYIGGGRFELMYLLLCILLVIIMREKTVQLYKSGKISLRIKGVKIWTLVIVLGIVLVFMAVFVTSIRRNTISISMDSINENAKILFEQFVNYNIGALASFDVVLETGLLDNQYYMGRATILGGVEEIIQYFLGILGIVFTSARTQIGIIFDDVIQVGNNSFNALYTGIAYFYQDLGGLGVAVISALFGYFLGIIAKIRHNSLFIMGVFFHMYYQYMILNFNWYFTSGESIMYLVLLWWLTKYSTNISLVKKA